MKMNNDDENLLGCEDILNNLNHIIYELFAYFITIESRVCALSYSFVTSTTCALHYSLETFILILIYGLSI